MQTLLFYDLETTGLNKAFDQILQFAAIRTDLNLREIDRHEIKIKLNADTIPSPYALLTHKIPLHAIQEGITEYEAVQQIHQLVNTPGTITLGYNTLGFDDEFLRFSFYRNLLTPYTHQYANQCSRMDIYPITVMYYLYKNAIIKWPTRNNQLSLKLEELNAVNQFAPGLAHDAMVDVEVTLALTRQLMQERDMWAYMQSYFNKQADLERIKNAKNDMTLLIDGVFGARHLYQCPAVFLATHKHYQNQSVWLRLDSENLQQTTLDNLTEHTYTINKKPAEPCFILPFKERFLQHLDPSRIALAKSNLHWLQHHPDIATAITNHYSEYTYPVYPNTDIDAGLYVHGFFTTEENHFCRLFHNASINEKANLIERAPSRRLQTLTLRLMGRHYPDALSKQQMAQFTVYLDSIFSREEECTPIDHQGRRRLSPSATQLELNTLRENTALPKGDIALLDELEAYLNHIKK